MKIETVKYIVLDSEERWMVRDCMSRCHPDDLSEDQAKVRNRLMEGNRFDYNYVHSKVMPYISWLLQGYRDDLKMANEHKEAATGENALGNVKKQWELVADAREQMIPKVEEVQRLFREFIDWRPKI